MPQLESELETSRLELAATCIQLLDFSVHLYRGMKERISKPKGKKMAPLSLFQFAWATSISVGDQNFLKLCNFRSCNAGVSESDDVLPLVCSKVILH